MSKNRLINSTMSRAVFAASIVGLPVHAAQAQDAAKLETGSTENQSIATIADIVVTAQRRSESAQNVPIAITALSGEQMISRGITQTTDIVRQVPSVSIYQVGAELVQFNIRGVSQNDFADHLEGPIAVYVDDAYIGASAAVGQQIFDMERVEVLRGPQGTLFGRNSSGGLVQFVSRAPTQSFEEGANVTIGNYSTIQSDAYVSGPLSSRLRARLAVGQTDDRGYSSNSVGERPQNQNNYSGRLRLDFDLTLSDLISFIASGTFNHDQNGSAVYSHPAQPNADGLGVALGPNQLGTYANILTGGTIQSPCAGCDLTGFRGSPGPNSLTQSNPGAFHRKYYNLEFKHSHNFEGSTQLTTVLNYQHLNKDYITDTDGGPSSFFTYPVTQHYKQYSVETRLSGATDSLKWQAGFYYLHIDGKYSSKVILDIAPYLGIPSCALPTCTTGAIVPVHLNADYALKVDSYAPFAQVDYDFAPTLSATLGVRYTSDHKRFDYHYYDDIGSADVFYNPATNPKAGRNFDNFSAKAQLNWRPDSGVLLYAGVSRGTKAGNWAAPVFPPINVSKFATDQEVLTSYEIGAKTELLDERMILNGAAFYYDYHNYQAFALLGTASQTLFNVDAIVKGAELEWRYHPVAGLELGLTGSYTDGSAKNVPLNTRSADRDMPYTGLTGNALIRYGWNMLGGELAVQGTANYLGHHYLTILNEPVNYEPDHMTFDLRLSYAPASDRWNAALWMRNVSDVKYRLYGLDVSALSFAMSNYAPPRTFGVSFGVKL